MRIGKLGNSLVVGLILATSSNAAETITLPMRDTPVPRTTDGVPHVQIGVEPVPVISAELLRRVSETPGIEVRPTIVSLPGALGFWVSEDVPLSRPDVIVRGREFAHIHPDGSLHASLPPELADRAVEAGWAVNHPWADQRPGWEGFVMIFTPLSSEELDLVFELVLQSYEFVTGVEASPL